MFSKNNPVVLLLDRSGFSLFQGTLVNILKFPFAPDIVANLEVLSRDQLFTLISSFIDKNRIYPSIIVVLLADALVYEKDLKTLDIADKEQQQIEIQNFLQKIPFEDILAKIIKVDTLTRLVAVNRDLIFSTVDPFIKKGFLIGAVVPCFVYGQSINFTNGLAQDIAQSVLRKQELLKTANLLTDPQQISITQNNESEKENEKEKKHKNLRPFILISVFVVLLIVLGILLVGLGGQEKNLNNERKNSPIDNTIAPSITPIPIKSDIPIGSTSAILSIEDMKITIVQNSQSATTAKLLKEALAKIGFEDIASENSADAIPIKSSVLFSKNIPTDIRQNTILEINKILPSISVLESESSDSKITILVGKS